MVFSFPGGDATCQRNEEPFRTSVAAFADGVEREATRRLFVTGSVDARPIGRELVRQYGTSVGLLQFCQ
jgi:hypothetical protein